LVWHAGAHLPDAVEVLGGAISAVYEGSLAAARRGSLDFRVKESGESPLSSVAVTRSEPAPGWGRLARPALALLLGGGLVLLVLAAASAREPGLAVHWTLGLALGVVLQRGRVCFAGAFRDLYLMRNGAMMRAVLVALALATPLFAMIQARAVPNPSFGALPPGAHVLPLGLHLVVGGLLFGIGMVVAGGCVSGTLYRIGEGYLASWASLGGILLGLLFAAHTWNLWWTAHIQHVPVVWLPSLLGYGGAVAVTIAALAATYVGVLWWESRDAGPAFPSAPSRPAPPAATLSERLGAVRAAVLGRGWPALAAVCALAVLNVAAYLVDHPLGVTGELAAWADRGATAVGFGAPALLGAELLAGCNLALEHLGLVSAYTMLDAGLVFGAFLAAMASGELKLRVARQRRRYVQSFGGGTLMGYGAGLAVGCTLGAFFSAVPSLGLNGWVFGLALLGGAGIGTRIIRRLA
jgi:uncharacterized membrane protein YedE/YeeE